MDYLLSAIRVIKETWLDGQTIQMPVRHVQAQVLDLDDDPDLGQMYR